jgi:Zn-dependent protease
MTESSDRPTRPPPAPLPRTPSGIRLFRLFGIDVWLHWMWVLVAVYEIDTRKRQYTSIGWNIAEYLTLFLIVLLHEFGHALACKSVGGEANRIMLWPLGGVAFVNPPQRPGAVLWSIAAGPLVNVVLIPITLGIYFYVRASGIAPPDVRHYLYAVSVINIGLLIFNMLPIYPLDGGQILRALLWFVMGRSRSLLIASVIGMIGAAGAMVFAISRQDILLIAMAAFGVFYSFQSIKSAKRIAKLRALPRHENFKCPSCRESPPAIPGWGCECGAHFDTFATGGACPQCGREFKVTMCPHCGRAFPFQQWLFEAGFPVITNATA